MILQVNYDARHEMSKCEKAFTINRPKYEMQKKPSGQHSITAPCKTNDFTQL